MKQLICLLLILVSLLVSCGKKDANDTRISGKLIDSETLQAVPNTKVGLVPMYRNSSGGYAGDTMAVSVTDGNGLFGFEFNSGAQSQLLEYYEVVAEAGSDYFYPSEWLSHYQIAGRDTMITLVKRRKIEALLRIRDTGTVAGPDASLHVFIKQNWPFPDEQYSYVDTASDYTYTILTGNGMHVWFKLEIRDKFGQVSSYQDSTIFSQSGQVKEMFY